MHIYWSSKSMNDRELSKEKIKERNRSPNALNTISREVPCKNSLLTSKYMAEAMGGKYRQYSIINALLLEKSVI